jgi:predicted RNA-binding protein associated with RNAse of E/G family
MSTTTYLDHFLDPITFTPEVARAIADLRAAPALQAEIDELRRKANEGTLTPAQDADYKDFVEAVDVISIIQSKARQFLARHPD